MSQQLAQCHEEYGQNAYIEEDTTRLEYDFSCTDFTGTILLHMSTKEQPAPNWR